MTYLTLAEVNVVKWNQMTWLGFIIKTTWLG